MERYKDINSITEVKSVLDRFQELYRMKDIDGLGGYINNTFSSNDGLVVLGSGMNQWCFNYDDIKALIESQWDDKNLYWNDINFNFREAKIFADENTAWVVSIGNLQNILSEDKQIEETISNLRDILKPEKKSKENTLDAVRKIAIVLNDIDKGENYVWPFRFTCVLIKEKNAWKFHQMQFSLDSESWNHRITDESYDKSIFEMAKTNYNDDSKEIRKVLGVFQEGYTKRDLNYINEYMKRVFLLNEDLVVIGTDAEELCLGVNAVRGIIESDWKYWGNFKLNVEDAIISVKGDVAYFSTKAILNRIVPTEQILEWTCNIAKYVLESEERPKRKLMKVLCDSLDLLYENERGDIFITPMRFSGVLVKKDEKWLIQHVQYSEYIDGMPGVRIVKL